MGTQKGSLSAEEDQCLTHYFKEIKKDLRMDDVAGDLMKEKVLTIDEWEQLRKNHPENSTRTEEFLFLLRRRPSSAYSSFIRALRQHGYDHLANALGTAQIHQDSGQRSKEVKDISVDPVTSGSLMRIQSFPQLSQQCKLVETDDNKQMISEISKFSNEFGSFKGEMKSEMKSEIRSELAPMKSQLNAMEAMQVKMTNMMQKMMEKEPADVAALKRQHAQEKEELLKKIQDLEKEIAEYKSKLKKKEQEMTQLKKDATVKEVDKLKIKLKEKKDELEAYKKKVENANFELAQLRPKVIDSSRKSPDDPAQPAHAMYQTTFKPPRDIQTKEKTKEK